MAYRAVTLAPGESYVLPTGAQIISVSNPSSLTSVNDCANLSNLESLECWIIPIAMTDQEGDGNHVWMNEAPSLGQGIYVAGIWYPYVITQGAEGEPQFAGSGFTNWVNNHPVLSNLLFQATSAEDSNSNEGGLGTFCFKAPASIATEVFIQWTTSANSPEIEGSVYARFYPFPYDDWTGRPKCPCTNPD